MLLYRYDLRTSKSLALAGSLCLLVLFFHLHQSQATGTASGWLKVSDNGHYFVKDGQPFFWLGDTGWSIVNRYSQEEVEFYLEHRRKQGFSVVHMMGVFDGGPGLKTPATNLDGEVPFLNNNPATPNDKYFRNVDKIIKLAEQKGILVVFQACGGSGGAFVKIKNVITQDNARAYGKWLGERYKQMPNIVWGNGFDLTPWDHEEIAREFAAGLREGDGGAHLISLHPAGGNSSSYFHYEDWLSANIIQVWTHYLRIYPMTYCDYLRSPAKPVIMAEGCYEAGIEYQVKPITPHLVRKQAYWSFLAGGYHTYGHNDIWRKNPNWRESLDAPGAKQMGILKKVFVARQWWKHVPDQSVFESGASGDDTLNTAARSTDGDSIIVYLSSATTVSLHLDKITSSNTVRATWVNPETGDQKIIGEYPNQGSRPFTTPQGQKDAILLLDGVTKNS
jgi:hypothetical protein